MERTLGPLIYTYVVAYFIISVMAMYITGVDVGPSLFLSAINSFICFVLLQSKLKFENMEDFLNKIPEKKEEKDFIVISGEQIFTGKEENEEEERFMRLGSRESRIRMIAIGVAYGLIMSFIIYQTGIIKEIHIGPILLLLSGVIFIGAISIGQLLMPPFLLLVGSALVAMEEIGFNLEFILLVFSIFICVAVYGILERSSHVVFDEDRINRGQVKLALFRSLKATILFFLFWSFFDIVIPSFDTEQKTDQIYNGLSKLNRKIKRGRSKNNNGADFQNRVRSNIETAEKELEDLRSMDTEQDPLKEKMKQEYEVRLKMQKEKLENLELKNLNSMDIPPMEMKEFEMTEGELKNIQNGIKSLESLSGGKVPDLKNGGSLPNKDDLMAMLAAASGQLKDFESRVENMPSGSEKNVLQNTINDLKKENEEMLAEFSSGGNVTAKDMEAIKQLMRKMERLDGMERVYSKDPTIKNREPYNGTEQLDKYMEGAEQAAYEKLGKQEGMEPGEAEQFKQELQEQIQQKQEEGDIKNKFEEISQINQAIEEKVEQKENEGVIPEKEFDLIFKWIVKGFMIAIICLVLFFLYKLLRSKKRVEDEIGGLDMETYKELMKKARYKNASEEIKELFRRFVEATRATYYVPNESPPPKKMEGDLLKHDFKRLKKNLNYFVEVFSQNHYGGMSVEPKHLKQFRKSFRKLMKKFKRKL